eukprot:515907-Hanusia_phi.AAC.1
MPKLESPPKPSLTFLGSKRSLILSSRTITIASKDLPTTQTEYQLIVDLKVGQRDRAFAAVFVSLLQLIKHLMEHMKNDSARVNLLMFAPSQSPTAELSAGSKRLPARRAAIQQKGATSKRQSEGRAGRLYP